MAHRMVPMIRQLRRKPLMECHDERWVRGGVPHLRTIWEERVLHLDMSSSCLQRCQPWHILAMNFGGIGEITLAKLLRFLLEMRLDQRNLRAIRWVFGRDGLQAAILQR